MISFFESESVLGATISSFCKGHSTVTVLMGYTRRLVESYEKRWDYPHVIVTVRFGVPQGSILGPMLFNLYLSDLQDHLPSSVTTFQYADDTTIHSSCRPADLHQSAEELNSSLNIVSCWSKGSHLALNPNMTKTMLLPTRQMSRVRKLDISKSSHCRHFK